jgi:nitrite reductase/ring-hydroxylating ferredoxin subunit
VAKKAIDRIIDRQRWLDPIAKWTQKTVEAVFRGLGPAGRPLKDFLHGTTSLRHPLHPALTDIPAGAWLTGVVADYVAISTDSFPRSAGTIALAVGLVVALGAAITGYTDFHETMGLERRTAIAHGLWMTAVFLIEAISLIFRLTGVSGLYPVAVALATVGLLLATVGMYVGGHVVYGFGTMVNRGAFSERFRNTVVVGKSEDFPEGQMRKVEANGTTVLVTRYRSDLFAISNVCSHAGGPLNEGTLEDDVVSCPWHGSRFCVRDGSVRGGPASFPQPQLGVREGDGKVEVWVAE